MPIIDTAENDIKERLSLGIVTLVAARAGCEVSETAVDRTSRDVTIRPIVGAPVAIDVQLKATVNLDRTEEHVKFDLKIKNYNDLRATQVANAQILVVVDLHELRGKWLRGNNRSLIFGRCAYWISLYDFPATDNQTTIRISIPKTQVFTPDSLVEIIGRRYDRIRDQHGGL